jgi:hypothetical protein
MLELYQSKKLNGNQPLAIAMSIFYTIHPEIDSKVILKDCGLSITTLRNYLNSAKTGEGVK